MATLATVRARALAALIPPPRLRLSTWIEANIRLPEGVSALPGPVRLWPYQREIADVISDPEVERVVLVKPVRVGFTTLLTGAIASFVANEPAPILCLLPTEADCRDYVVSDIEPVFAVTPALRGALSADNDEGDRNTLLSRRFPGGSLKIVAAKAPRNLRRHTARILIVVFTMVAERTRNGKVKGQRYPHTKSGLNTRWRRNRKAAGIKAGGEDGFRFHDFRHDLATKALRETGNLKLVQRMLNHADLKTTARYAHVLDGEVGATLDRLMQKRDGKFRTKSRTAPRKVG